MVLGHHFIPDVVRPKEALLLLEVCTVVGVQLGDLVLDGVVLVVDAAALGHDPVLVEGVRVVERAPELLRHPPQLAQAREITAAELLEVRRFEVVHAVHELGEDGVCVLEALEAGDEEVDVPLQLLLLLEDDGLGVGVAVLFTDREMCVPNENFMTW